jgi:hypothetical protein
MRTRANNSSELMKWLPPGVLLVALILLFARGGAVMMVLGSMLRFLLYFFLFYLLYKMIRGAFTMKRIFDNVMRESNEAERRYRGDASTPHGARPYRASNYNGTTIDICPQCGEEIKYAHRCKK